MGSPLVQMALGMVFGLVVLGGPAACTALGGV